MKNLNSIISRLSRSGLLSQTSRGATKRGLKPAVTDTIVKPNTRNQSPLQTGALAAVGGMAWKAYQVYSQQAYGQNTSLHKANLHRAYQLGVYAQRNAQQEKGPPNLPQETTALSPSTTTSLQSRYTPSSPKQALTYSPATLSQQQFDQVVQDESHDTGQMLLLRGMITAANADGHIDENERQQIYQQVDDFDLNTEDKAKLFDELRYPLSFQELIDAVPDPQTAIEVYAASLLAIDEQHVVSKDYLSRLACSMAIPAELVKAIHKQAE